jgi:hypothetical protein
VRPESYNQARPLLFGEVGPNEVGENKDFGRAD